MVITNESLEKRSVMFPFSKVADKAREKHPHSFNVMLGFGLVGLFCGYTCLVKETFCPVQISLW